MVKITVEMFIKSSSFLQLTGEYYCRSWYKESRNGRFLPCKNFEGSAS